MDERTRDLLQKPFDASLVKKRRGPGGRNLSYVEVSHYIARLNEAFAHAWSFEIVGRERIGDEVIVEARLTASGITKTGIGGASINRRRESGEPVSVADDIKAASSDALKRCCRLLGLGAELYSDDPVDLEKRREPRDRHDNTSNDNNGAEGRVTVAQLGKLQELVAETGSDWRSFRESVRRRLGSNPEYLDRRAASELIGELIEQVRRSRGNGGDGRSYPDDRRSW